MLRKASSNGGSYMRVAQVSGEANWEGEGKGMNIEFTSIRNSQKDKADLCNSVSKLRKASHCSCQARLNLYCLEIGNDHVYLIHGTDRLPILLCLLSPLLTGDKGSGDPMALLATCHNSRNAASG